MGSHTDFTDPGDASHRNGDALPVPTPTTAAGREGLEAILARPRAGRPRPRLRRDARTDRRRPRTGPRPPRRGARARRPRAEGGLGRRGHRPPGGGRRRPRRIRGGRRASNTSWCSATTAPSAGTRRPATVAAPAPPPGSPPCGRSCRGCWTPSGRGGAPGWRRRAAGPSRSTPAGRPTRRPRSRRCAPRWPSSPHGTD